MGDTTDAARQRSLISPTIPAQDRKPWIDPTARAIDPAPQAMCGARKSKGAALCRTPIGLEAASADPW
jgi:hypothetical protein